MAKIVYKCEICGKSHEKEKDADDCCLSGMRYCKICGKGYTKTNNHVDVCCIENKILDQISQKDMFVYKNISCGRYLRISPNYTLENFIGKDFMNDDDSIQIFIENNYSDYESAEISIDCLKEIQNEISLFLEALRRLDSIKKTEIKIKGELRGGFKE